LQTDSLFADGKREHDVNVYDHELVVKEEFGDLVCPQALGGKLGFRVPSSTSTVAPFLPRA